MGKNKAYAPTLPRIRYMSCVDLTRRSRCNSSSRCCYRARERALYRVIVGGFLSFFRLQFRKGSRCVKEKTCTPRTDHRFLRPWSERFLICTYGVDHVAGWEPYDLHDVSRVWSVLYRSYRSCSAPQNGRLGFRWWPFCRCRKNVTITNCAIRAIPSKPSSCSWE